MKKPAYAWYIQPLDAHTNEVLANELPDRDFHAAMECEDGEERALWECSHEFAYAFCRSRKELDLKLHIFNREGKGKVRKCDFLFIKKKTARK